MKSDQDDLISVIIPFYNEKIYFDDCINSVLNQSYKNLEIIIINDGSDQICFDQLNQLAEKFPKLINVFHKKNEGVASARNYGIKKASGKYISFIDADDRWLPNKIEHQIEIIKKKNLKFIHGSYFILDSEERVMGKFLSNKISYSELMKSCDIGLSTVMLCSNLAKENLFPNITTKEDYVCWLRIIKKISYLHGDIDVVTFYRRKKNSLSSNITTKFLNAFKVYHIYEKVGFFLSLIYTLRLSIYYIFKENLIRYKNLYPIKFNYIVDFQKLNFDKSFILVALNMASLSYTNLLYGNCKNIIFWIDGVCARFVIKNYSKTAGRKIIEKISVPENINNIILCGNKSDNQINYLKSKLKREVEFIELPFFKNLYDTSKYKLNIKDNSLIILNIATPKQEIIANNILKNNYKKKIFILCLGGGIAMASGEEEVVPEKFEKMNLEWLWRLRTDTFFRLKRLTKTAFVFFIKKSFNYFKKINFIELN